MTPIFRPECPDYLFPYLANGPHELGKRWELEGYDSSRSDDVTRKFRRRLVEDLVQVFGPICCYCESYAHPGSGVIERHRPRRGVRGENPYLHLHSDWRNLYWACPVCDRYKGNRFPQMGLPLPERPYLETVEFEEPGLLDPCRDNPDEHLAFDETGQVSALSVRGDITIKLLDLNRRQLIQTRFEQVQLLQSTGRIHSFDEHPAHRAVWRQLGEAGRNQARPYGFPDEVPRSQQYFDRHKEESPVEIIDTESKKGMGSYLAKAQYVTRLEIKNYGPIHHLDLNLEAPDGSNAPCYALLGENGVGKSTVLKALALTLSGEAYSKALRRTSNRLLATGAHEGSVVVTLVGGDQVSMSFRRNKKIEFSNEHSRSLVVAYGATRLLATARHKSKPGKDHAKIDNLFDPFLPINDPTEWLKHLGRDRLDEVNDVLRKLMPKDHQVQVIVSADASISLNVSGVEGRQLRELSDGYQCMIGMAVDIMQVLSQSEAALDSSEGIVLIDELGNHFHPAWRLQCLPALREAFPGAQIIYSTHDPLCLRGLKEGEVAVLRRDRLNHIYALENLPSVANFRVDQLLTSEHFGLRSTVDPELDTKIEAYEELLSKPDRSDEEEQLLADLVAELTDTRYLGGSRRERMALQMLDTTGALDIPVDAAVNVQQFTDSTVSKLKFLMQQVTPLAGQPGASND
ncbi:AAA family ATPase [Pseudomonas fluorescens]|uniref:AAA family ATPase n=2 Tax=Pseudomonas TaxID=286 RepID=UPI001909D25F|nr:AAA family ATPase [Pseudomonas sp. PA-3-10C]MBK3434397.1 AAA family ATPase [Pseudomonas fluorescens]MBK3481524.1 AAA family ATPase [Pseudomonas fluorescens]